MLQNGLVTTAPGPTSTAWTNDKWLVTSRRRIQRAVPPAKLIRQISVSLLFAVSIAVAPRSLLGVAGSWLLRREMRRVAQAVADAQTEAAWRQSMEDSALVGLRARDAQGTIFVRE